MADATRIAQVERARAGFARRPGVVLAPLVGPGLEDPSLRKTCCTLAFEKELEEGELDLLAKMHGGIGVEGNRTERGAVVLAPAAVTPWPHHQDIGGAGAGGFTFLYVPVPRKCSPRQTSRPPSAPPDECSSDAVADSRGPEIIVVRVLHHGVPERNIVFEVLLVAFASGPS